jgi:hypothetical protein
MPLIRQHEKTAVRFSEWPESLIPDVTKLLLQMHCTFHQKIFTPCCLEATAMPWFRCRAIPVFPGIPVTELLNKEEIEKIVERTRKGGGELVNLMGTSAWYAPGAAAAQMVEAIVDDQHRIFPVSALLNGEYGMKNVYMGVPVVLGKDGIEEVIELNLNADEMKLVKESAKSVKVNHETA